jgi:hypothetical protein
MVATHPGEWVIPYISTGKTTIVIPVPANEIVRAVQNTANARFLRSPIINLRNSGGYFALHTIRKARVIIHPWINDLYREIRRLDALSGMGVLVPELADRSLRALKVGSLCSKTLFFCGKLG